MRIEPPQQPDYLLLSRNHIDDLSRSAADKLLTDSNEYGLPAERSDVYLFNAASSRRKPPSRAVRWASAVDSRFFSKRKVGRRI